MKNKCGSECVLLFWSKKKKKTHSEDGLLCSTEIQVFKQRLREARCRKARLLTQSQLNPPFLAGTQHKVPMGISLCEGGGGGGTFFDPDENNEWERKGYRG